LETPRLKIATPVGPVVPGRGFYQIDEDRLIVPICPPVPQRFFSYLDADDVGLDFDQHARLICIDVHQPRRHWIESPQLTIPRLGAMADVRWLAFRDRLPFPVLSTSADRRILGISYSSEAVDANVLLASHVILQIDSRQHLVALWVLDIADDRGGRELAAFRRLHQPSDVKPGPQPAVQTQRV
jgi:hypothetical protein